MIFTATAVMDYFILKPDGEQTGTFSIDQIRAMLNTGFIGNDTRYWHEGITDWQPIDRIEESLNFPEHRPTDPHPAPPPVRRLSGSIARAIPSPQQLKRAAPSSPILAPSARAEKPLVPGVPPRNGEIVAPSIPVPAATVDPLAEVPTPDEPTTDQLLAPDSRPPVAHRPRQPARPSGYLFYAVPVLMLALATSLVVVFLRTHATSPLSSVTLAADKVFVLHDQASIRPFEDDMRNNPVVDSLKRQIEQSTDAELIQRLKIGLEKEAARHSDEVTQQYIAGGKAEFIQPGRYDAVAYFDDNGVLTFPSAGQPWVALTYRGEIVYACLSSDLPPEPQGVTPPAGP
jgi:hypothetical protein